LLLPLADFLHDLLALLLNFGWWNTQLRVVAQVFQYLSCSVRFAVSDAGLFNCN
jgi:hypothetical protein